MLCYRSASSCCLIWESVLKFFQYGRGRSQKDKDFTLHHNHLCYWSGMIEKPFEYKYFWNYTSFLRILWPPMHWIQIFQALSNISVHVHLISVINWDYSTFCQHTFIYFHLHISLNCAFSCFKFNYTFISTQFTNLFTHSYIVFIVIYMIWNMLLQLWPHHQTFVFCLVCWLGHVTLPFLYSCTICWITSPILHFSACNLACGYP